LNAKNRVTISSGPSIHVECFLDVAMLTVFTVYGAVLMTGKGTFVVGKQQMAFDVKYFH
jgi:hypothetical protein